jgi:hypothetical protein
MTMTWNCTTRLAHREIDRVEIDQLNQKFPRFDTDIHGLVADETSRRSCYFVDCVAQ